MWDVHSSGLWNFRNSPVGKDKVKGRKEPYVSLTEILISVATIESSLDIPQKPENRTTSYILLGLYPNVAKSITTKISTHPCLSEPSYLISYRPINR